jgi:hypothetical protein
MLILMYPSLERLFLTTGVYYLIQLLRSENVSRVVLLVEFDFDQLDINHSILQEYVQSGKLHIIRSKVEVWGSGYDYHKRCKEACERVPKLDYDVLFMPDDIYIMNNYLLRFFRCKSVICYQTASSTLLSITESRAKLFKDILNERQRNSLVSFLKHVFYIGDCIKNHALNYFLFPAITSGKLFYDSISMHLMNGDVGKQADFYIVFGEHDKKCCVRDGTKEEKVIINGHPLEMYPELCGEMYQIKFESVPIKYDFVFFQTTCDYASEKYYNKLLLPIIRDNWKLAVKLHPGNFSDKRIVEYFSALRAEYENVDVFADYSYYKLASEASIIFGEETSVLETIAYVLREKPIISVNIDGVSVRERFKNHPLILYTETVNTLLDFAKMRSESNQRKISKPESNCEPIGMLLQRLLIKCEDEYLGRQKND